MISSTFLWREMYYPSEGEVVEVKDSVHGWRPAVVVGCTTDDEEVYYDVSSRLEPTVHVGDLSAALSVVCDATRSEKVEMALPFYVSSGGGLTMAALTAYLTSLFKAMLEASSALSNSTPAERMGAATARRAFYELGVDEDEEMPLSQFHEWYSAEGEEEDKRSASDLARESFGHLTVEEAYSLVSEWADDDGRISRVAFEGALGTTSPGADALFDAFDTDSDGRIDLAELAAGLSVWCSGTKFDRIRSAFHLFDANGDGHIDQEEMARYLTSVFRVALANSENQGGHDPESLGTATAAHVFETADRNHDGVLSFDEFSRWYETYEIEDAVSDSDVVRVLSAVLRGREPAAMHARLMAHCREDLRLFREDFYSAFEQFGGAEVAVLSKAFDLFDADHDGTVNSNELSAGLATLCGGDRDAKVRFCFERFDADGDGYLTPAELEACLGSVFKVVNGSFDGSLEPNNLAKATAQSIVDEADLDGDGRVSYDEFDRWLALQRGPAEDDKKALARKPAPRGDDFLVDARRLLGISRLSVDEVVETFSGVTSPLQIETICRRSARLSGQVDDAELKMTGVLAANILDSLGGDSAKLEDVVVGILTLVDAPAAQKVQAAFGIYGDGGEDRLDRVQLANYLCTVYSTLFAIEPSLNAKYTSPGRLADCTADLCFAERTSDSGSHIRVEDFIAFAKTNSADDADFRIFWR